MFALLTGTFTELCLYISLLALPTLTAIPRYAWAGKRHGSAKQEIKTIMVNNYKTKD